MYQLNVRDKKRIVKKGPTSKYYVEHINERIKKEMEMGKEQENKGTTTLNKPATTLGDRYFSTGWQITSRSTRPLKKTPFGTDLLRVRTPSRHPGEDTHFASFPATTDM